MRIGIDATPLPSQPVGAGTYIIQLIRALAEIETNHELIIFSHQSELALYGNQPEGRIEWFSVPHKTPALRLLWEQSILPKLAKQKDLDILHSMHYTSPNRLHCSSVVTFHDLTFFLYPHLHTISKRLVFPYFIHSSVRHANAIIAVSETTRQDAIRILRVPEEKIFTIPHGVSADFHPFTDQKLLEECRKKYRLPKDFILYLGTIEPRKNLPLLLRAFSRLMKEDSSHKLVLAGNHGWMVGEVYKTIRQLQLEEFVQFTGYIPSNDLPMIYNLARIFVYPSIYEGFGLPPIEAMACGTPVIASAIPVNMDHIGDAGLLFPPDDEQSLFLNLLRLINDPKQQAVLSSKGQESSKKFTWQRCAMATLEVYEHVETY